MARMREVTRTITVTEYTVLAVNMENMQVETIQVFVPSACTMSEKKRDQAIRDLMPSSFTLVQVMSFKETDVLYAMSETDFIEHAHIVEGGR